MTGPRAYYRPKEPPGVTVSLTREAKAKLEAAVARTGASRSDVVEQLIRRFGGLVRFAAQAR